MKRSLLYFLPSFIVISILGFATSVNAQQVQPVPEQYRIPLTNFLDGELADLRTDGTAIYWWDSQLRQIIVYSVEANEFFTLPTEIVLDLHAAGQWIVYQDADRSDGFITYNTVTKITSRIDTPTQVDSLRCMNSNAVAYTFDNEFYLYSFLTGESQLISSNVNPNYIFCSLFDRFISYNDQRTGGSVVYFHDLVTKEEVRLSGDLEGRSSVIIGTEVYFAEQEDIYVYDIITGTTSTTLYQGSELKGYLGGTGVGFLSFRSSFENGLQSVYLAIPQYGYLYRMSDIDRFAGIHDFWNGIITWIEFQDGKMAIFASNFKNVDSDADLLTDAEEILIVGSNPFLSDTDQDGYDDGTEVQNGYDPLTPAQQQPAQPAPGPTTTVNNELIDRVAGQILLQVESHGEAWYVDPVSRKRYYLKDGDAGYSIMRLLGLGITNNNLSRIPEQGSPAPSQLDFVKTLLGRILLQVESRGEAWYVSPNSLTRIYLRDGQAAFQLMREQGLGITNADLQGIPIGNL